jgi:hypothetical protein
MRRAKTLFIVILALMLFHCSKQTDPTPKEQMIKLLTSDMWTTESVQKDEAGDVTSDYAEFGIAFESRPDADFDGDYYVAGGGRAFPELVGQWKFNADFTRLVLANGREMDVSLSATSLVLTFSVVPDGGRVKGVIGRFTFRLKKK